MVQIKLSASVAFLLASIAIPPVVALPASPDGPQPFTSSLDATDKV